MKKIISTIIRLFTNYVSKYFLKLKLIVLNSINKYFKKINSWKEDNIAEYELLKLLLKLFSVLILIIFFLYRLFIEYIVFNSDMSLFGIIKLMFSFATLRYGLIELLLIILIYLFYRLIKNNLYILYYNFVKLISKLNNIKLSTIYNCLLWILVIFYIGLIFVYFLYRYFDIKINLLDNSLIKFSLWILLFIIIKSIYQNRSYIYKILNSAYYFFYLLVLFICSLYFLTLKQVFLKLGLSKYHGYMSNIFIYMISGYILFGFLLLAYNYIKKKYFINNQDSKDIYNAYKKAYELLKSENIEDKNKKYKRYIEILKNLSRGTGNIGLLNDDPISLNQKDILGYKKYADDIYRIIKGLSNSSSLSIGILGEWGIGKSSIINLLTGYYLDDNPNYKILRFNPWDYDKDKLISAYFEELSKLLSLENGSLRKQLKTYADYISKHINIPYVDIVSLFLNENNNSLEAIKNNINKSLKDINKKIIVIIDDLDRCMPDEIISMLNIIKNLGNFSNTIYLVSYDKKQIINVLRNKNIDSLYLEKIINVERHITNPSSKKIKNFFEEIIKLIFYKTYKKGENPKNIFTQLENDIDFKKISSEFEVVFNKENLRFVKKILNELNIIIGSYYNEIKGLILDGMSVDEVIIDLITIIYVRLKDFNFYSFVVDIYYNGRDSIYTQEEIEKINSSIHLSKYIRDPYIRNFCKKCLGISIYDNYLGDDGYVLKVNKYKSKYEFLF